MTVKLKKYDAYIALTCQFSDSEDSLLAVKGGAINARA